MKDYSRITKIKETEDMIKITKIRYWIEFIELYNKDNLFTNPIYICTN